MNIKQSTVAAAVTAALAMGMSGQAAAYVYAGSVTELSNLVINISPFANATIDDFNFTTTNTAMLNGASIVDTATCFGKPGAGGTTNNCGAFPAPVLDGPTMSMGAPARPVNTFTLLGPNGVTSWSNSDSLIPTAQLVDFVPSSAKTVAEAELNPGGVTASANSEIQSTTNFTFSFTLANPGDFDVTFDADSRLWVEIFGESVTGNSALASDKFSVTLTALDGSRVISWAPNGSNFCDDNLSLCTASDGAPQGRINANRSIGSNGSVNFDPALTSLALNISGLTAGKWSLGLNVTNSVVLTRAVPEPGMLALLGIGLLGLGISTRRNKELA